LQGSRDPCCSLRSIIYPEIEASGLGWFGRDKHTVATESEHDDPVFIELHVGGAASNFSDQGSDGGSGENQSLLALKPWVAVCGTVNGRIRLPLLIFHSWSRATRGCPTRRWRRDSWKLRLDCNTIKLTWSQII
jgi:hypothetical protein